MLDYKTQLPSFLFTPVLARDEIYRSGRQQSFYLHPSGCHAAHRQLMFYLSSFKPPRVLSSIGRALGKAETPFLWACNPSTADLWLLEQQGMLQRWGSLGRIPSLHVAGTGMLWDLLSHGQSLPYWESCWPRTQAEQPQMHCISRPCLSFPAATD